MGFDLIMKCSQVLRKTTVSFPPPSPFKAVLQLVDSGQSQAGTIGLNNLQEVCANRTWHFFRI